MKSKGLYNIQYRDYSQIVQSDSFCNGEVNPNPNIRNKITYLSFVMAVLIVYRHSVGLKVYNIEGLLFWIELFISHLTDIIVPCFFAMSGYLFYQNFTWMKLKEKWKSRIKTIVFPFFVWNLIGFFFFFFSIGLLGDKINKTIPPFNFLDFFCDVFIYTKYNITWFLANLICYIYIFPLLAKFMNSRTTGINLILLLLFLGYYFNSSLLLYSVPYAMGAYISFFYKNIAQQKYSLKTKIIAMLFIVTTIIYETIYDYEQGIVLMPIRLCQIIAIWILADFLAINITPKWWMTISFFIYCSHSLILETIQKVFYLIFGNTSKGALIDFICAPIITLLIIYGLAFYCRKMPKVWGLLVGYR